MLVASMGGVGVYGLGGLVEGLGGGVGVYGLWGLVEGLGGGVGGRGPWGIYSACPVVRYALYQVLSHIWVSEVYVEG